MLLQEMDAAMLDAPSAVQPGREGSKAQSEVNQGGELNQGTAVQHLNEMVRGLEDMMLHLSPAAKFKVR
jgi:hypothetical protein